MGSFLPRTAFLGCFAAACFFLCHCAKPLKVFEPESGSQRIEAEKRFQSVLAANSDLETIKGLGRVKLRQDSYTETFRAAWIGKRPNRFRLELWAVTGQRVISFSGDGSHYNMLSHLDNQSIRKRASANVLKRFISIEIKLEDLLDLLSGRLPVPSNGTPHIEVSVDAARPYLTVVNANRTAVDRIYLGADQEIRELERRNRSGKLLFRISFEKTGAYGTFQIPDAFTITNEDGVTVHLDVEKCWVNPEVSEDRFVLELNRSVP